MTLTRYQEEPRADLETLPRHMREIIELVADRHHLHPVELLSETRERRVTWPRQEAMYLIYERRVPSGARRWSMPNISDALGFADHTTVLHGIRRYKARLAEARARQAAE